jgi:rhomboid family GlyGly-CTERM serine protease
MEQPEDEMKSLRPPLLLFALPTVLLAFASARHDLLLLDREALGSGHVWRLWSGHWLHFSAPHLGWNLAVLLTAGTLLERLRPGLLVRHVIIAAPLISAAIMIFEPGLSSYGGLSGLATGVVVLLCLHQLRIPGSARLLWTGVLALVAARSLHDVFAHNVGLLVTYDQPMVRTSTTAHAAGAVVALLLDRATCLCTAHDGHRRSVHNKSA